MDWTRIVSFDLSFSGLGWAEHCLITDRLSYDVCAPFREKSKSGDLHYECQRLSYLLNFVKARVDPQSLVIVEDFAFARANQAHQLGGLGYLVRFWLWQQNISYLTVAPSMLKKFVSGKGNAPKQVMLKDVFRVFGIDVWDDNVADAIGLNFIGRSLAGSHSPTNATQRAVVAELTKKYAQVLE